MANDSAAYSRQWQTMALHTQHAVANDAADRTGNNNKNKKKKNNNTTSN